MAAFSTIKFASASGPSIKPKDYSALHKERNEECGRQQASKVKTLTLDSDVPSYDEMVLKARHAFEARAKRGVVLAQYCLATYYRAAGVGGDHENFDLMIKWYQGAAERGDMFSQYSLGIVYGGIAYDKEDFGEALNWYRCAAEQGDARAQTKLGNFYSRGMFDSVVEYARLQKNIFDAEKFKSGMKAYTANVQAAKLDYVEARKWYRLAALQGDIDAQFRLGFLHYFGWGGAVDHAKARTWYSLTAENGNAAAKYALERMN